MDGADRRTRSSRTGSSRAQDAALARLRAQDFERHRRSASSSRCWRRRGGRRRRSRTTSGASSQLADELEEVRQYRPAAFRALPVAPDDAGLVADLGHRAMIVNQWVPAAHRGDAVGDNARVVRDLLRALGPRRPRSTR